MPLPKPTSGESQDDFVARCIPVAIEDGMEQDQATAACFSIYREKSMEKQRFSEEDIAHLVDATKEQDNTLERVLFNPTIYNATLCDFGANEFPATIAKMKKNKKTKQFRKELSHMRNVSKQADGTVEMDGLLIVANRVDAHGDLFLPEDIKIAADRFMQEGRTSLVDIQHDEIFGKAHISEFYIVKDNDPLFDADSDGELVGSLAARIKVTDDGIKQKVLKGELQGFSIYGESEVQVIEKSIDKKSLLNKMSIGFERLMADVFGVKKQEGELTMAEIQDIMDALAMLGEKLDALMPAEEEAPENEEEMEEALEKSEEDEVSENETEDLEKSLADKTAEAETLTKAKEDLEAENTDLKDKIETLEKGLKEANDGIKKMEKQVRDFGKTNGQDKTASDKEENKVFLFGR